MSVNPSGQTDSDQSRVRNAAEVSAVRPSHGGVERTAQGLKALLNHPRGPAAELPRATGGATQCHMSELQAYRRRRDGER